MTRLFRSLACAVLCTAGLTHAPVAVAQSLDPTLSDESGWRHSVTPYLFLPLSTEGTSTIDGTSADLDLSLSDVLDLLQGAASLRYEGWNGDFGVIAEAYYVRLAVDETLPGPAANPLEVDVRQGFLSLLGGYRFAQGTNASGLRYAADVSAGVRWNQLRQEVDIGVGPSGVSLGSTEEWWEPVIGLRYASQVTDKWTFGARAELGGFGANGSDLQYVLLAGFDLLAWEKTSLRLGYQFYGLDFSTDTASGEFAYDVDQHGPYIGLTFRF